MRKIPLLFSLWAASQLLVGIAHGQNAVVNYKATATTPGSIPVTPAQPLPVTPGSGGYFYAVPGSVTTRAANTTTYTANTTVCANTSVTVCAPGTIAIANTKGGQGVINRLSFLKSTSTTTSANFTVWMFSAAPGTASPNQFDNVAYTGPRAADMPNYIGAATCTTPVATSDTSAQIWYECTLSNPNSAGALVFQALSGTTTIDYLISVTAAYAPGNAETFQPFVSGFY